MTIILKTDNNIPDAEVINKAAKIIIDGGLVAFPTDTVYGLGADAMNPEAVSKMYQVKSRPQTKPLLLLVHSIEQAEKLVFMNDTARKLAHKFWPGPLTLVLRARPEIPSITRAGLDTAGVRMPDNPIALALIKASRTAIAAPSANISGHTSPKDCENVFSDLGGKIDMILDGGKCKLGLESTIVNVSDPQNIKILRQGSLSCDEIVKYNRKINNTKE